MQVFLLFFSDFTLCFTFLIKKTRVMVIWQGKMLRKSQIDYNYAIVSSLRYELTWDIIRKLIYCM